MLYGFPGAVPEKGENQCHAEGGTTKGGVSKCEQTQANADKRGQTQANAEAQTQANASKREQTRTNANKRLHPPLLRFFTPPFAIPLEKGRKRAKRVARHPLNPLLLHTSLRAPKARPRFFVTRRLPRNVPRRCPRKCPLQWSGFTCPVFDCSVPRQPSGTLGLHFIILFSGNSFS